MMIYENHTEQELLDLYNRAKEAYYGSENPIMTDQDFDSLEQYLVDEYNLDKHVGMLTEVGNKVKHWNRMLSLAKIKIDENGFNDNHLQLLGRHLGITKSNDNLLRIGWKYDGLAMTINYSSGKLLSIATRGDGVQGVDVTDKFKSKVPQTIDIVEDIEIRVECCMSKSNFEKHYSKQYSHPRNLASGIKADHDPNDPRLQHIDLIAVDAITKLGRIVPMFYIKNGTTFKVAECEYYSDFGRTNEVYERFAKRRSSYDYPNDGLVLFKNQSDVREHNGHDPSDAIAIKFPPETFNTTVKDIYWALSKHGKYIPVVLLEPVKIDGRMIGRVSGYNYGNVKTMGIAPGAEVEIAIMGDIIPAIKSVVKQSTTELTIPSDAVVDGVHLKATESEAKMHRSRWIGGVLGLGFDGIGGIGVGHLYDAIYEQYQHDQFDYTEVFKPYIDEKFLTCIGDAASKKMWKRLQEIKNEGIPLRKVIHLLGLTGLGGTLSVQVARHYSGLQPDWFGLEKKIIESACFGDYSNKIKSANNSLIVSRVPVHFEKHEEPKIIENEIKYVLTGSPKDFGFKTKDAFKATLPTNWTETANLKEANMLITDDMNSSSSKMKAAIQLNLKIVTYGTAKTA